ncbi:hypothetical protein [Brevibacterium sediminis]|uniref:hypothetical protein n=1 Tax=Brevibacterium sediminis TaxID=1857024 RepID=UPI00366DE199
MNSLPGNPFVGEPDGDGVIDAVVFSADDSPMQTTELLLDQLKDATLALAHEQRTATLVNMVRMYADLGMAEQAAGIIDAITNRLGGDDHE